MTPIKAKIAGEIELNISDVPSMVLEQIKGALTFPNEEREKRAAEDIFGWWDLPETIPFWRVEQRRGGDHVLLIPRGFASPLVSMVGSQGYNLEWDDQRVLVPSAPGYFKPFVLRDYQLEAVIAMMQHQQGFYECPAGGGKTVTVLGMLAWLQQRALIIVDKAGLLEQWRVRAHEFYGFPLIERKLEDGGVVFEAPLEGEQCVGKIGDDVWEERGLTIALRQTLWSREWETKATKWFRTWGFVGFDEGHHLGAETLGELSRRVESKFMLAFSATPSKSYTHGLVVHALVGPVVHKTERKVLYERGILMQPRIEQIRTGFETSFWPTHKAKDQGDGTWKCQVEGCKKTVKHGHRNNYASALKKLVEDPLRNGMIASKIVSERGHVHLVPSRQLKHLTLIRKACEDAGWDGPIYMLRGEENARGESQIIAQAIDKDDEAIIFSTVADEGLDIPPIDRIHIVFPMKQELGTIQLVGRGERTAPSKEDSIVYDYVDASEPFSSQAGERWRTYSLQGYAVCQATMV